MVYLTPDLFLKRFIFFILSFPLITAYAQQSNYYPEEVAVNLNQAGVNKKELEKAINYFKKSANPLKLKAAYFLIANMDIHLSFNSFWVDSLGNQLKSQFNELDYPDYEMAIKGLADYKKKWPGCYNKKVIEKDLQTITGDFLIENINLAFEAWEKTHYKISFDDFCEYILPYRIGTEPLQRWRSVYQKQYSWLTDSLKQIGLEPTLSYLAVETKEISWSNTFGRESNQLLPRLGALQLLLRKKGECPDMIAFTNFKLRSQGIPASFNMISHWATTANRHFVGDVFKENMEPIKFDATAVNPINGKLFREPAKVLRETFSKQKDALSNFEEIVNIPPNFLRNKNYIDVTREYWEVGDIKCDLNATDRDAKTAYICVYNDGTWHPTWWGKIVDNQVVFKYMCKGAVFLPAYYKNGILQPAGSPIAFGYNNQLVLTPEENKVHKIVIKEEDKYLFFRAGKAYELFYWNNEWISIGTKNATQNMHEMVFDNVPENSLLLLQPEYSEGKERPFMIMNDGKRYWW